MKKKVWCWILLGCILIFFNGCSGRWQKYAEFSEDDSQTADSWEDSERLLDMLRIEPEGNSKYSQTQQMSQSGELNEQETEVLRQSEGENGPENDKPAQREVYSEQEKEDSSKNQGIEEENIGQDKETELQKEIQARIDSMTLEEKAAQLFIVYPEDLIDGVDCVTAAADMTRKAMDEIPVGGFIYLRRNLRSEAQVKQMLSNVQIFSMERIGMPAFLCIDEEGGTVAQIGRSGRFDVPHITDMAVIGQENDKKKAFEAGAKIGEYLSNLGFNVDFAPVADVLSNPENTVVKKRSFGSDPNVVTIMASAVSEGLQSKGIFSVYKHYPGHGATAGDSHEGYSYTDKTIEELKQCELVPFINGIQEEVPFIMVGHISLPQVLGDHTPASLSSYMIHDLLRNELGYKGIVITDALSMGAIRDEYSSEEAAVKALEAGADMILLPYDFKAAYRGVIQAVEDGILSRERIDESLKRIFWQKLKIEYQ